MNLTTTAANREDPASGPKTDSTKKSRWVALIAVPLVVAVIGVVPSFVAGGSPGNTYIDNSRSVGDLNFTTNVQISDPAIRSQFDQAIAFARQGLLAEAKVLFEQIAPTVQAAGVYTNLAIVNAALGDDQSAQQNWQHALLLEPDNEAARENLSRNSRVVRNQQGNSTILNASPVEVGRRIESRLTAASDSDYFSFTAPAGTRDILRVQVDNRTATFAPDLRLFDSSRAEFDLAQATRGANTQLEFVATPGATYYAQVTAVSGDVSDYVLSVTPLRASDRFEPNDDILTPTPTQTGQQVDAGIMDPNDIDVYRVAVKPGPVRVVLTNRSATLAPYISLYDEDKSEVIYQHDQTPGSNVSVEGQVQRGGTWYVRVHSAYGAGLYTLRIEQ
jgi:flagellar basal body-associated protein FliL